MKRNQLIQYSSVLGYQVHVNSSLVSEAAKYLETGSKTILLIGVTSLMYVYVLVLSNKKCNFFYLATIWACTTFSTLIDLVNLQSPVDFFQCNVDK